MINSNLDEEEKNEQDKPEEESISEEKSEDKSEENSQEPSDSTLESPEKAESVKTEKPEEPALSVEETRPEDQQKPEVTGTDESSESDTKIETKTDAPSEKTEDEAKEEAKSEDEIKSAEGEPDEKSEEIKEEPKEESSQEAEPTTEPEEKPKKETKLKKSKDRKSKENKLLFDKYDLSVIEIADAGLVRYMNLEPIVLPHVSARYANKKFGKSKMSIVERLINGMMRTEKYTGKKFKAYNVVKDAFEIVAKRTKQNPVQILVQALENGAPKEEIVRLRFGGILVPKSVDSSPSRRLDISMRNLCKGSVKSSHKNRRNIATCLAEEMILASKNDMNSFAINKKEDIERVAASAR